MFTILLLFALDPARLEKVDSAVESAIAEGQAPGAVVLVLHQGKVVYRKAFGKCGDKPMSAETVFDLASLTKPLATGLAVMKLVEAKKLRLEDPVSKYVPGFKAGITLEHLLLHTSGLPAGSPVADFTSGMETALKRMVALSAKAEPGKKFVYSDLGYITLGAIVEKTAGQSLDAFCTKEIFTPLGLTDTGFRPAKAKHPRIAPTEKGLRGAVHDPRARVLGGVAGHAGLFSSADDLAILAQMLLDEGKGPGERIFQAETVRLMTRERAVPSGKRAYGWDVKTAYSSNRGDHFAGFGHTGFTGTSLWIDPPSKTAVIILTSRLAGKGNVIKLRRAVANRVAEALTKPPYAGGSDKPASPAK